MAKLRVFLADDHPIFRSGLRGHVDAQPDMEVVGEAADGKAAVLGITGLPAYLTYMAACPAEHPDLCEAILIHRTECYRDPEVWAHLAGVIVPGIVAAKAPGACVRAWSAGCATA